MKGAGEEGEDDELVNEEEEEEKEGRRSWRRRKRRGVVWCDISEECGAIAWISVDQWRGRRGGPPHQIQIMVL